MNVTYPITIFYDASCPICKSEMEAIKISDVQNKLNLVDCSPTTFDVKKYTNSISQTDMMTCIHALDANGAWLKGVDVFAAAYSVTGFDFIAAIWANKTLRPITTRLYPWIANNRQLLSKTGLPFVFNSLVKKLAQNKANKTFSQRVTCADDACTIDAGANGANVPSANGAKDKVTGAS